MAHRALFLPAVPEVPAPFGRIGIDLGTDSVRCGVWQHGRFRLIAAEPTPRTGAVFAQTVTALADMKARAEAALGVEVTGAAVTVPAHFDHTQRHATLEACSIAGLGEGGSVRLVNAPSAAAIAFRLGVLGAAFRGERTVLLLDLGAGSLGCTLLTVDDGILDVKATAGDPCLGGDDIDAVLVDHFAREFKLRNNGLDLARSEVAMGRLRATCEAAKRTLSSVAEATLDVGPLLGGVGFRATVTRPLLEELSGDLLRTVTRPIERVLADAKMDRAAVDDVVLVGGSTRIPKVQQLVSDFFGGKELNKSINPDEAVAYGAAVQAFVLDGHPLDVVDDFMLLDASSMTVGVEATDGTLAPVVSRNTALPTRKSRTFALPSGQRSAHIRVLQGECDTAVNGTVLGTLSLTDLAPAATPAAGPEIEVTFDMDANGILTVSAEDKGSGKKTRLGVTGDRRLLRAALASVRGTD